MHHLAKTASNAAQEFYEGYLSGMVKRAQDEIEVETSVPPSVLKQAGGVRSLLDKVAMENPEAVLPEGTELPPEISDIPEEGGIEEGGFPGAPEEGGIGDEDLEAIGAQLEEAGVTPEELQQAIEDVQALQEAGVSPEDLAAALEGGGDIPEALAPPADAIPEEILDPAAKEASGQTLAKLNEILNR